MNFCPRVPHIQSFAPHTPRLLPESEETIPTLSDLPCCPPLTTASKHAHLWTGSLSNSCFHGADWKDRLTYGVRPIEGELCVFETQNKIFHYRSRHWHNYVVRTTPLLESRFIFASVRAVFAQFGHSFVQVLQR